MYTDLSSVNLVFNMTTITSNNFFNMNCDVTDYPMAHISSVILLQAWMISALNSITVYSFFSEKPFP
jgi:hypothetical protein